MTMFSCGGSAISLERIVAGKQSEKSGRRKKKLTSGEEALHFWPENPLDLL
jgi:hypothetical protein